MPFNFTFRGIDTTSDIYTLIDFMRKQALDYQGYDSWLQRSEPEFHAGYKQAVLAFSESRIVADAVYQPHKSLPRVLEIKNLRVHPNLRRRDFGHFMLRQVEVEARKTKQFDLMMIDARASQKDILTLLKFTGYKEIARTPLYDSNEEDVVFSKPTIHAA